MTEDTQINGEVLPNRRSACDRCREHKLRCPRNSGNGPCERCVRARATCVTGKSAPMGRPRKRPPTAANTPPGQQPSPSNASRLASPSGWSDFLSWPLPAIAPAVDFSQPRAHSPWHANTPNDNATLGSDPFFDRLFQQMMPEVGEGNGSIPPSVEAGDAMEGVSQITPTMGSVGQTSSSSGSVRGPDILSQPIERLSHLNISLASQLQRVSTGPWNVTFLSIVCHDMSDRSAKSNPLGDILRSSSEFLSIINAVTQPDNKTQSTSYCEPSDTGQSTSSLDLNNTSASNLLQSVCHVAGFGIVEPLSFGSASTSALPTPATSTGSSDTASELPCSGSRPLETPIILLIASCYLQILRVYDILLAHVYEHLRSMGAATPTPSMNSFAGLQLGGFPLQSGNLQVIIAIQVILHILQCIDTALGIPLEYRVSGRNANEGTSADTGMVVDALEGLLADSFAAELFKLVIKQEEKAVEIAEGERQAKYPAARLRENMKKITQLLQSHATLQGL